MAVVSVIIPVYNVEAYLDACVKSVCRQKFADIEIILVDDGSTDQSGRMCDGYAQRDERIVVIHKENGGLGDARNAGISYAQGKYMMFLDSDDWLHEDAVNILVEKAEKGAADVVIFDYRSVEPGGKRSDVFSFDIQEETVLDINMEPRLVMCSVSAVNKLYKKSLWDENNMIFPTGRYYEDLGTIPKIFLQAERVVYVKKVLYYYRMREGSIMHSSDFARNYKDRTAVLDDVCRFYKENKAWENYHKELEYLIFENAYFVPSKEIILNDRKSPYLKKFRKYAFEKFPEIRKNPYIRNLSVKDRILLFFLDRKMYGMMILMSGIRQMKDHISSFGRTGSR